MEPLRISRNRKLRSILLKNVQDNARSLFDILNLQWSYPCSCQMPHRANLQLSMYSDEEANISSDEDAPNSYDLLFTFENNSIPPNPPPLIWRDIEVESSPLLGQQSEGSIRFSIQPSIVLPPSTRQSATLDPPPSLSQSQIDDLCKVLIMGGSQVRCLGFLEDRERRHHLFSVPGPGVQEKFADETTLHRIVYGADKFLLGPREKYAILKEASRRMLISPQDLRSPYFLQMLS